MATTHIKPINVLPSRTVRVTVQDSNSYYMNPKKTDNGRLVTAINCEPDTVNEEMLLLQKQYELSTGKAVDESTAKGKKPIILYVARQSFLPGEIDADTAHAMGVGLAERLLGGKYQCIVTTHIDTKHIHNNILWNAVGLDLKKYDIKKYTYKILRRRSDELCKEFGTSIVIPGKERRPQKYSMCKENSFRDTMRSDVDAALAASSSFADFLKQMEAQYDVAWRGQNLRFRHKTNGQQRPFRVDSLGEGYDEQSLRRHFQVSHIPQNKIALTYAQRLTARQKLALSHGKPLSYSAQLRNIKAMVQVLRVIEQNGIQSYSDFGVQAQKRESAQIEIIEASQSTHAELRRLLSLNENLQLYQKYKPLYEEYSNSILKERFREKHRAELDVFTATSELLQARGYHPEAANYEQLAADISAGVTSFEQKLTLLETELTQLNNETAAITKARRTVDRLHEDYLSGTHGPIDKTKKEKEDSYVRR